MRQRSPVSPQYASSLGAGGIAGANDDNARATLRNPAGARVGTVVFVGKRDATEVRVRLTFDPAKIATDAFHGMHVHLNGDPANGEGCIADPAKEPTTWFVSADGHWKAGGQDHSSHTGDLPSIYVTNDGSVDARFLIGRVDRAALTGKAVIVHASADNFGNVPVGTAANQYSANSADATTLTKHTGNAGPRLACGVVGDK